MLSRQVCESDQKNTPDNEITRKNIAGVTTRGNTGTPFAEGALTKRTSLSLPPKISIEEWGHIGRKIFVISESSTWWLGDWLIYGQAHYPDRYMRAIEKTQLDYQTLRNYAWVARRYPVARRMGESEFSASRGAGEPSRGSARGMAGPSGKVRLVQEHPA